MTSSETSDDEPGDESTSDDEPEDESPAWSLMLDRHRKATDWMPATSKRLRQRMFLQASTSSVRTM